MPTLQLYCFGTLDIRYDDRLLDKPPTAKSQSLLVYLTLHRERPQSRERLASLFWGERPERKARSSLSTSLWHIRRCLPDKDFILSDPHAVQFDPHADLWLDTQAFEAAAAGEDVASLQSAAALYRGDLLDGFYDDWVVDERYRLETMFYEALARLMVGQEAGEEHSAALSTALRLLGRNPLREDAHRLAMRMFCRLGQRNAALEQYRRCQEVLQQELGAEPMVETTNLRQAILEGRLEVGRVLEALPVEMPVIAAGRSPLDVIAASPLVGREQELAFLHQCWREARGAGRGAALVSGEAGVGKTRLMQEFADQLRWRGARVLWGGCYELERSLPYQPITEALRTLLPTLPSAALADLPAWVIAEVARLTPEIAELYPDLAAPVPIQHDQEQARLFNGLARFLTELAARESLLVVLEDLHWAGESTLQLIHYLVRHLSGHRGLLVGTWRPEEIGQGHSLAVLQQQLKREGLCQPLHLERLSSEAVAALVQEMSGAGAAVLPLAQRLYRETEGNPFFLMEIIKAIFESGVVRLEAGAWRGDFAQISVETLPLPDGVSKAIQGRVHRLGRETQDALRLAAVLGHEFDFDLLDTAWGQGIEATLGALDDLLRCQLIDEGTGKPDRDYAFTHHKIQEVIYADIPQRRRQYTHGLVGAAMEQLYEPQLVMSELAFHFEHAQRLGKTLTAKAVTYLRGAGEQAATQYANAEAVSYLSRALNLTPETNYAGRYAILLAREKVYHLQGTREPQSQDLQALKELADALEDDGRRGEVALRRAEYAGATGDVPAAITAAREAIHLGQAVQDVEMEAAGRQQWGQVLRHKGDHEAARTQVEAALTLAQSASLHALEAESLWGLGNVLSGLGDYASAKTLYEQSLGICRKIGYRLGEGKALGNLGFNFSHWGDYGRSEAHHKQALRIHREIGDRRSESRALVNIGVSAAKQGDYARARGYYEQAQEIAHEIGDPWTESSIHNNLGSVARRLGDYAGARLHFEQALRISRETGNLRLEGISLTQLGNVSRYQGEYIQARVYYEQALSVNRQIGYRNGESTSLGSLGLVSRGLGNYAQARTYFEQALQITREIGLRQNEGIWLANLSLLCHRLEEYQDALLCGEQALGIFQDLGDRPNQGYALTYLGHARESLRHLDKAAAAYQQALSLRRELEQPHLATEPLAGLARIALGQGDPSQAQDHVEEILGYLETGTLSGTDEPFRVYLTCYQVLHANRDPRAQKVLSTVYDLLQEQAAKITDEELRRSFLENIASHREIVAAMTSRVD